jgi:hypothetical protein
MRKKSEQIGWICMSRWYSFDAAEFRAQEHQPTYMKDWSHTSTG